MIIDCVSDLHGHYPKLDGGDLLIVAGDLTAHDTSDERIMFLQWLADQDYLKKVWIAGNHDNSLIGIKFRPTRPDAAEYLCDSGTEFEGLKIWGSPWTKRFEGMNPDCMAFTVDTEEELAEKWALIPQDTDILITHCPAYSYLDKSEYGLLGSPSLRKWMRQNYMLANRIKLHVCGHIHEGHGQDGDEIIPIRVNASHVNERYEPVNKPIRIEL